MKRYKIKYCGRKLDEATARCPKEALEQIRDKINFEVVKISHKNSKANKK